MCNFINVLNYSFVTCSLFFFWSLMICLRVKCFYLFHLGFFWDMKNTWNISKKLTYISQVLRKQFARFYPILVPKLWIHWGNVIQIPNLHLLSNYCGTVDWALNASLVHHTWLVSVSNGRKQPPSFNTSGRPCAPRLPLQSHHVYKS